MTDRPGLSPAILRDIPVGKIDPNPENPRILFRQGELDELMDSIAQYGVQVPVVVYAERGRYVLIDGERRWRCATKLNLPTLPGIVQEKPSELKNLLLMFNIHALREQWDLFTIALKLPRVEALIAQETGFVPNEAEVSRRTGLTRAMVRRARLLRDLPDEHKETILAELTKPKARQKLTEDLYIEMERALTTVQRHMPDVIRDRDTARRVLLEKVKSGVIRDRADFRDVSRIARADKVDADVERARNALRQVFQANDYSIGAAYAGTVEEAYAERDVVTRVESLMARLEKLAIEEIDDDLRDRLEALGNVIRNVLGDGT